MATLGHLLYELHAPPTPLPHPLFFVGKWQNCATKKKNFVVQLYVF
jgi:hypothetical protein